MALGEIKEKLKEKLHLPKHHSRNSSAESTSHAPNRHSIASDGPARDRLSHDRNARSTFAQGGSVDIEDLLTTHPQQLQEHPTYHPRLPQLMTVMTLRAGEALFLSTP